jgi:WD40 repeat protein
MRRRSPHFWSRVRTFSGIAAGIGIASALFSYFPFHEEEDYPARTVQYLAFAGDGRTLIGSGEVRRPERYAGEVYGWDVATGRRLWTEAASLTTMGASSALMPDGESLVTVIPMIPAKFVGDGSETPPPDFWPYRYGLIFRDARSGRSAYTSLATPDRIEGNPSSIDVSPSGRSVAAAFSDRVVVWSAEPENGLQIRHPRTVLQANKNNFETIVSARFTTDSTHLIVISERLDARNRIGARADLVNVTTGAAVHCFREPGRTEKPGKPQRDGLGRMEMADLSPDRRRIATFRENDAHLSLWDVATGKRVAETSLAGLLDLPGIYMFYDLKFRDTSKESAKGACTVSVTAEDALPPPGSALPPAETVVYWKTKSGRLRKKKPMGPWWGEDIRATSPDGSLTAASTPQALDDRDEFVCLRNTHTGQVIRVLRGNGGPLPPRRKAVFPFNFGERLVMRATEKDGQ